MTEESKRYKLNRADGFKIGKGALIALGGALLTYVAELLPQIDFGAYTPIVVGISSVIINTAWKFLRGA